MCIVAIISIALIKCPKYVCSIKNNNRCCATTCSMQQHSPRGFIQRFSAFVVQTNTNEMANTSQVRRSEIRTTFLWPFAAASQSLEPCCISAFLAATISTSACCSSWPTLEASTPSPLLWLPPKPSLWRTCRRNEMLTEKNDLWRCCC